MKKKVIKNNIFNIPSDDARKYLQSIVADVNTILNNDKFMEATKKAKLPDNASIKDYEELIKRVAPKKIYNWLMLLTDECYDEIRRILSAVFVTDFEEYRKKSLEQMVDDISLLKDEELLKILRFFIR